jgi:hypothetical protein
VIAIIVGLHFLGLWRVTGAEIFIALAGGLCLVGRIALWAAESRRLLITGFGCAFVLWASAAATIISAGR